MITWTTKLLQMSLSGRELSFKSEIALSKLYIRIANNMIFIFYFNSVHISKTIFRNIWLHFFVSTTQKVCFYSYIRVLHLVPIFWLLKYAKPLHTNCANFSARNKLRAANVLILIQCIEYRYVCMNMVGIHYTYICPSSSNMIFTMTCTLIHLGTSFL